MAIQINVTRMFVVKIIWVASCLMLLLVSFGAYADGFSHYNAAALYIPGMVILTFPAGLLAGVFLNAFDLEWTTLFALPWLVLFAAGYCQWFIVLPAIADRSPTFLKLREPASVENEAPEPSEQVAKPEQPSKRRRVPPKTSFAAFDREGRTPLQRALHGLNAGASGRK